MTATEYPFCVTITKPGFDTVHLGFPYAHQAEHAVLSLKGQMRSTAHPEGTAIAWGETPDGIQPEPSVPTDVYILAELIEKMPPGDGTGGNFPDLYARLQAQEGDAAHMIWMQATNTHLLVDDDSEPQEPHGVTAGYDPETDAWHVEVHIPGQPVERIGIGFPLVANAETAQNIAAQTAENRGLPHIEWNYTQSDTEVLQTVRDVVYCTGEDNPTLIEALRGLRAAAEQAATSGWSYVPPQSFAVIEDSPARRNLDADGIGVSSLPDGVMPRVGVAVPHAHGTVAGLRDPITMTFTVEQARALGAALIDAAKHAYEQSRQLAAQAAEETDAG